MAKGKLENKKNIDTQFDKIALPTTEGIHFIEIKEIVLVEADSNYCIFYFLNRKKMIFSKTLKQIEQALEDYTFFRVHKSYLINIDYIAKYSKGNASTILMQNNMEIELSRSHKKEFLNLFERV